MCRRWPLARLDSRQISLNRRPDAVLREQRILSAWDHEPLLAPQPEAETVPVADLPAHVLHEHKEVSRVVGVLDGGPQVCLQHGAEGGLALALPQPFDVADGLGRLSLHDDGQAMLPAEPV